VVVADECKLQQEPNACYRWSKIGQTPMLKVNRKQTSISIYGGLSLLTKHVISYFCSWQDSAATLVFLEKLKSYHSQLKVRLKKDLPLLLVWDNARWHKSKAVREWLAGNPGVLLLMNFPPYSPELNPQEHVWKALKQSLITSLITDNFQTTVKKAGKFLKSQKFDYRFW
jgi:transposase